MIMNQVKTNKKKQLIYKIIIIAPPVFSGDFEKYKNNMQNKQEDYNYPDVLYNYYFFIYEIIGI